jgi:hypothetical protein
MDVAPCGRRRCHRDGGARRDGLGRGCGQGRGTPRRHAARAGQAGAGRAGAAGARAGPRRPRDRAERPAVDTARPGEKAAPAAPRAAAPAAAKQRPKPKPKAPKPTRAAETAPGRAKRAPAPAPQPDAKQGSRGGGQPKTTICHATGSETNPYVEITIAAPAVRAHQRHQDGRDIVPAPAGGCPKAPAAAEEPAAAPAEEPATAATARSSKAREGEGVVGGLSSMIVRVVPAALANEDGETDEIAVLGASETQAPDTLGVAGAVGGDEPVLARTAASPQASDAGTDGGTLPFTGWELAFVAIAGAAALLGGVALRRASQQH